jgi:isoleucyl-tRNA synthetase
MGHAVNKVLKDIINRYKMLRGHRVMYVPGWDCHGLPIELKVTKSDLKHAAKDAETPVNAEMVSEEEARLGRGLQTRKAARRVAEKAMVDQAKGFVRWGVMADWSEWSDLGFDIYPEGVAAAVASSSEAAGPNDSKRQRAGSYCTMDPQYEQHQLEIFKELHARGLVTRGLKPVYWSPSSRTALAESELEYLDDHKSVAAYVRFPLSTWSAAAHATLEKQVDLPDNISALIWTTTPWTIPSNMCLCVNAGSEYALVRAVGTTAADDSSDSEYLLVATDLVQTLEDEINAKNKSKNADESRPSATLEVLATLSGTELFGTAFTHPLCSREAPVILGDHVTTTAGTGIVHTAPGHGHDDFDAWTKHHLASTEGYFSLPYFPLSSFFLDILRSFLPSILPSILLWHFSTLVSFLPSKNFFLVLHVLSSPTF